MPVCRECGRMAATAEMRRSKRKGQDSYRCKDTTKCSERRRALREAFKKR